MQTIDKIDALDTFRKLLPLSNLVQYDGEIRYRFKREASARHFEQIALDKMLNHGLPLVAEVEVWESGGVVFEVNLVVSMAPEEVLISH